MSGSTLAVLVLERDGMPTPSVPVTASGRSACAERSPKPLPKKTVGVTVLKRSAPTDLLPVPPTSHSAPMDTMDSSAGFVYSWYLAPMETLSQP